MDIYQEQILEHYKEPHHFGELANASYTRHEVNTSCGDDFTFFIHVTDAGIIDAVGFTGQGCAISTAAASLLADDINHKPLAAVLEYSSDVMLNLLGIPLVPTRLKCALLPLQAVTRITQPPL
ncbi:MAG: iron-sulfur cluster assembly scaffold protein [Candidatus Kerfeldbacteria bacterium]|nr:iron-sulfur cluster assembly scaffold protein [Candidatus Kerfeldbacteria bacterium]